MPYSAITDLLIGDIPLPTYVGSGGQKYVDDASNEIDSHIGFLYKTPIDITDVQENPVARPVRLLLKRIASHLSSGRILMAVAAPGEGDQTHAYGASLVREALAALEAIVKGDIKLDGVDTQVDSDTVEVTAALIANVDAESHVEAFYDRVNRPFGLSSFRDW